MTIIDGTIESSNLIFPAKGLETGCKSNLSKSSKRCVEESRADRQRASVETFPGRKQQGTEQATPRS